MNLRHIAFHSCKHCGYDLGEVTAPAACGAENGQDADLGQKRGQSHHQVLLAVDHRPFTEDIFMTITMASISLPGNSYILQVYRYR